MNTDQHGWTKRILAVIVAAIPSAAIAQEAKGLDAVGDEAVVQELYRYGMNNLLDRYFATHQV